MSSEDDDWVDEREDTGDDASADGLEDAGVLDASDTLDDDAVQDPLDAGVVATDNWTAANRFGTTAAEEEQGESLDQRLAEEEPDVDPFAGSGDDEDELSRRGYERDRRAGRLVSQDAGIGPDEDEELFANDVGVDSGAASAEEAAVHLVDDPDGDGDGPLR